MTKRFAPHLLLGVFCVSFWISPVLLAAEGLRKQRPPIYDESADGAKQIDDALCAATKQNKRVLLQFGANWCGWCHRLHKLCETDEEIRQTLKDNFVVALIDVNKGHNKNLIEKYHGERLGLPFIVILDDSGKRLTIKNTGELEEGDHHSPQKVLEFLNEW